MTVVDHYIVSHEITEENCEETQLSTQILPNTISMVLHAA
jgi:hypothetical protein